MASPVAPVGGAAGRTTLADVAARAGVAVSTVSRALSDPGRVNVHTRHRIEVAAEELGYRSSRPARPPAGEGVRTGVVAVLVPNISDPFTVDLIRGTHHELRAAGRHQLLIDTEGSDALEEVLLTRAKDLCDGAVLGIPRLPDARIDALERATVPLVTINRPRRQGGSVVLDTAAGMAEAVEHLVSLGHRRIVYVSGPRTSWSSERRWRSISRTAARLGAKATRTGPHPPSHAAGTGAAEAVVNLGATAVIAFNDMIAISMLQRFAERSVRVPEDVSLVGCDDTFIGACTSPALTTIASPTERAARTAVSLLLTGGTERRSVVLPTHLVVRGSTGPVRS
ncbi:LacI family transcriptional regulator [Desertihabitans brevis]|uniref:LacI family transcriptional regulator n=1 Tax=Desertihabitans brevis TaxID=2268447 RepID=A0A367YT13_9ACTN|nr:LacI family DNA-binding transcriptional regulator [Desertihabitans brevis]RCK68930.1 LacI family transcriptional regulator [Desertihabitans brevis]